MCIVTHDAQVNSLHTGHWNTWSVVPQATHFGIVTSLVMSQLFHLKKLRFDGLRLAGGPASDSGQKLVVQVA